MFPTSTKCLVFALMTCVVVLVGTFCGVQPSIRLAFGPTVAPFGPQSLSGSTPVFVAASNAPYTALGLCGSTINNPPWQKFGPANVQPAGVPAICGIETWKRPVRVSQAGCSIDKPSPAGTIALSILIFRILWTPLEFRSPFAANRVPKGGSSALLATSSNSPSDVISISSPLVVPPVGRGSCAVVDDEDSRSNTLSVLSPSPA